MHPTTLAFRIAGGNNYNFQALYFFTYKAPVHFFGRDYLKRRDDKDGSELIQVRLQWF
jgi:hypothetical protein